MMAEKVSDEMLMCLADGELDPETGDRLRALIARDPDMRARYERFRRSAEATRGLFADTLAAPPPERLVAALRPAPASARPRWRPLALAASVALAAAGVGYMAGDRFGGAGAPDDGLVGLRAAAEALETRATGEVATLADGGRATVLASYDTSEGACRQFQLRAAGGEIWDSLGCRDGAGWRVVLAFAERAAGGYVPAEGAGAGAIDAYLVAIGASPPLDPEAEAERARAGWGAE